MKAEGRRRACRGLTALAAPILALGLVPALRAGGGEPAYRWSPVAVTQPPLQMHPGQKVVLSVLARNDGTATWFADGLGATPVVRLAATPLGRSSSFASEDPTWLWTHGTRVRLTTPAVPPGGVGAFVLSFTAPVLGSYPADFTETFAPIAEGLGLLEGGPEVSLTTRVRPASSSVPPIPNPSMSEPPCDAPAGCVPPAPCDPVPEGCVPGPGAGPAYKFSVVAATQPPLTMHPGLKTILVVILRNEGTAAWHADGFRTDDVPAVRLAATPLGRQSAFGREDPTWLWSAGTRTRMASPVVQPGDAGVFVFTFTAPVLGSYPRDFAETFAPIAEGVGLMDGPELRLVTSVRPVSSILPPIPDQPVPTPPCDAPVGCLPTPLPCEPVEGCVPTPLPTPLPTSPCDPNDPLSCSPTPIPSPTCDPADPLGCLPPVPGPPCLPVAGHATYRDVLPPAVAVLYAGSGTPFTSAGLLAPAGVAIDGLAKIAVADTGHDRVLRMDGAGNVLFSWGSTGTGNGRFASPAGVGASNTAIFVADTGNNRIQVFSLGGTYIRQFGGAGSALGNLDSPRGVSVIASGPFAGGVAIADTGNDRVQILSPTGEPLSVVGAGELEGPSAVSVYANEIYVADTGHDRVVRYSLGGEPTGVWGGAGGGLGCMRAPAGVVANDYGLFVSDTGNNRIERFSRAGPLLESWGTTGSDANQLRAPAGLVMDATAVLWVADTGNNRLQRFRPAVAAAPPVPCGSDPFVCIPPPSAAQAGAPRDECIDLRTKLCEGSRYA